MIRLKALMVGLALGSAAGACARGVTPYQAGSTQPVANALLVRVLNQSSSTMDVYSVTSGGDATRLGTVSGSSSGSFVLDPSYFPTGQLRLIGAPIAGNGRASSGLLNVMAGHDDVYALLSSGYTILFGSNPQEAADLAAISYKISANSLIPVANAMDGFTTSHMLSETLMPEKDLL